MKSRRSVFWLPVLLLVVSLSLVACERPLQEEEDVVDDVATEVAEEAEAVATEVVEEAGDVADEVTEPEEASTPTVVPDAVGADEGGAAAETPTVEVEEEDTGGEDTTEETGGEDASPRPGDEEDDTAAEETTDEGAATDEEEVAGEEAAEEEVTEEEVAEEEVADEDDSAEVESEADDPTAERVHIVQPGENLYRIGLQYGVSWAVIAQYNNLPNANAIYAGQELRIPPAEGDEGTPTPTPSPEPETTYVVQPGDTLYAIGQRFGLSWVQIAEANGIVNPNRIFPGQELIIAAEEPGAEEPVTHTVNSGETLFTISLLYGVTWTEIAEANDLTSPYVIYPGQTLVIPGG